MTNREHEMAAQPAKRGRPRKTVRKSKKTVAPRPAETPTEEGTVIEEETAPIVNVDAVPETEEDATSKNVETPHGSDLSRTVHEFCLSLGRHTLESLGIKHDDSNGLDFVYPDSLN